MTGVAVGYAAGTFGIINQWISLQTPLMMFAGSFIGSFLPDLDSDEGRPFSLVFDLFAFCGGCVAFYICLFQRDLPIEYWVGIPPGVALFIRYGIGAIFRHLTVHRGIFHSIPAALIVTLTTSLALVKFSQIPLNDVAAIAVSIGLGYLSHLILDEVYSAVNFEGLKFKPKKSLGTALTFTSPSSTITAAAYIVLIVLFMLNWPLIERVLR